MVRSVSIVIRSCSKIKRGRRGQINSLSFSVVGGKDGELGWYRPGYKSG